MNATGNATIPMTVLGGFLGTGKTTLLNRILAGSHGVRYAVLVNDFGAIEVDGSLVAAHDGDTITFANGCLCCAMGDDLVGAIDRLLDGGRRPEQILVEASGVADPAPIADVATLHPELARDRVVVLADAGTLRARHADPRLRETVARQLDAADLLLLNKCDCADEEERRAAESWARDRAGVPVIRCVDAQVPLALLSATQMDEMATTAARLPAGDTEGCPDAAERSTESPAMVRTETAVDPARLELPDHAHRPGAAASSHASGTGAHDHHDDQTQRDGHDHPDDHDHRDAHGHRHGHDHTHDLDRDHEHHHFVTRTVHCPDPLDPARLRTALRALLPLVLRAKGFVVPASTDHVTEDWMVVQASGRMVEVKPWRPPPNAPAPVPGIVFIGLDDLPSENDLARAVRGASTADRATSP